MKSYLLKIFFFFFISSSVFANQRIVILRHAEKPPNGLGQLTCQGLNRSLALPRILLQRYGRPDFIFVPNPTVSKLDKGALYSYVRPLATIEPTAIQAEQPINTQFSFLDVKGVVAELALAKYKDSLIFIAWEHHLAISLAKTLLKVDALKPNIDLAFLNWPDDDFDRIIIIDAIGSDINVYISSQGLNNMPTSCP
jgi:hypothetical protein